MAIGTLRCFVIDVGDLDAGVAFWSEVTGIPQIRSSSDWTNHRYLGYEDEKTWKHELILHRVPPGLTRPEREALAVAAEQGPAGDAHWRAVARTARHGD